MTAKQPAAEQPIPVAKQPGASVFLRQSKRQKSWTSNPADAANLDLSRLSKRGPTPLDPLQKRDHCVSVRLNSDELFTLDAQRAQVQMQRGEYLRAAALHQLPPTVPAINREAWVELSRVGGNLNQLMRFINSNEFDLQNFDIELVKADLGALRNAIINVGDAP